MRIFMIAACAALVLLSLVPIADAQADSRNSQPAISAEDGKVLRDYERDINAVIRAKCPKNQGGSEVCALLRESIRVFRASVIAKSRNDRKGFVKSYQRWEVINSELKWRKMF